MKSPTTTLPLILAALLLPPQNRLQAATVSIHPTADTTLQQAYPDYNFGDGTSFQAGGRRQGGAARGLLLFDIGANVPAGATINSVSLTLNVTMTPSGGVNSLFDLRRASNSWGEGNNTDHGGAPADPGEATWNNRFAGGSLWTTAGGDFAGTVSASSSIAGNGAYTFSSTPGLIGDVQGWVNTPGNNFGWILISELENSATTIRRFGSRDSGSFSPTLTINFTPVPEPSTWLLLGLGGVIGCIFKLRRKQG